MHAPARLAVYIVSTCMCYWCDALLCVSPLLHIAKLRYNSIIYNRKSVEYLLFGCSSYDVVRVGICQGACFGLDHIVGKSMGSALDLVVGFYQPCVCAHMDSEN